MKPIGMTIYVKRVDDYKLQPYAFKITHNYAKEKTCIFATIIQPRTIPDLIFVNQKMFGTLNPTALIYTEYFEITYEDYTRVELQ